MKCKNSVSWKPCVKRFMLYAPDKISRIEESVKNGTWKDADPKYIEVMYPKRRTASAIPFRDRVYQRIINDKILYPLASRRLIYANAACQKGKGTDFAIDLLKRYIRSFFARYGLNGFIVQLDISGYYRSMPHSLMKKDFCELIRDDEIYRRTAAILDRQSSDKKGYYPGSQMIQIGGIYMLNRLDHFIKEKLHAKYYIRYNDDFLIITHSYGDAVRQLNAIIDKLEAMGFRANERKTHIRPLSRPFEFLGFIYRITETGKIIMTLKSAAVKHERKKLYRAVRKSKHGDLPKWKVDQMYDSWKAHARRGNSYKLLRRVDEYYKSLWKDEQNGT